MSIYGAIRNLPKFIAAKSSYLEILRVSGQKELTPEWLKSRYGSVSRHALLVGTRLWLLVGLASAISLFAPETIHGIHMQDQKEIYWIEDYNADTTVFESNWWLRKDFLEVDYSSNLDEDSIEQMITTEREIWQAKENGEGGGGLHHEWIRLSREFTSLERELFISIVEPSLTDGQIPHKARSRSETPYQYPLSREDHSLDTFPMLCELKGVRFEREENGQLKSPQIGVLVMGSKGGKSFIAPATLRVSLKQGTPQPDDAKAWEIDSVELDVRDSHRVIAANFGFEKGLYHPLGFSFDSYSATVKSVEDESQTIIDYPDANPVISKMLFVGAYVLTPVVCALLMAVICAVIGQRNDERPVFEIFKICAHLLLSASGIFCASFILLDSMFSFLDFTFTDLSVTQIIFLLFVIFVLLTPYLALFRFFIHHFALQVTAACRYPVDWSKRSRIFGLRRANSLPSVLFRIVALGIFFVFNAALLANNWVMIRFDLLSIQLGLY